MHNEKGLETPGNVKTLVSGSLKGMSPEGEARDAKAKCRAIAISLCSFSAFLTLASVFAQFSRQGVTRPLHPKEEGEHVLKKRLQAGTGTQMGCSP